MRKQPKKRPKRFKPLMMLFNVLLMAFLPLTTSLALAQSELSPENQTAIGKIAGYEAHHIDRDLGNLGYQPAISTSEWRRLPAVTKIRTAFWAAERAEPGVGGQVMLARLARAQAQRYESARAEPDLSDLMAREQASYANKVLQFEALKPVDAPEMPREHRAALVKIAQYSEGGDGGSATRILTKHLGYSMDEAIQIRENSRSAEAALRRGFASKPVAQHRVFLGDIIYDLSKTHESVKHDSDLRPYLDERANRVAAQARLPLVDRLGLGGTETPRGPFEDGPGPRPGDATPGGGGGGGVNNGPRAGDATPGDGGNRGPKKPPPAPGSAPKYTPVKPRNAAQAVKYDLFRNMEYPTPSSRRFRSSIRSARGFGGVIFGEPVSGNVKSGEPRSLSWASRSDGQWMLNVHFDEGVVRSFGPVPKEDLFAAYVMIYSGIDLGDGEYLAPVTDDEMVGLVGIYDPTGYINRRWNVMMYPILHEMSLGRSALMVDIFPIMVEKFRALILEKGSKSEIEMAQTVIENLPDTWKVTNAPCVIIERGKMLEVQSQITEHARPANPKTCLLFRGLNIFEEDEQASKVFSEFMPVLVKYSEDYRRLNQFAKTFALVRWLRNAGASIPQPPPQPELVHNADVIWVNSTEYKFGSE